MKTRTETIKSLKNKRPIVCLTSYDSMTAKIFDESGIDLILVGDSAANTVLGKPTTLPITLEEMISFGSAVSSSVEKAMVVIDMPFGSYEISPDEALKNSIEVMKRTGADAVKLEGGSNRVDAIKLLVENGIPVMGHLGFTPQSVNQMGGFKVQGRGEDSELIIDQAKQLQEAGLFSLVLEMVPTELAGKITEELS
ncbi:MAG TPA: 3-methyl-2-oxobutanoate hydroxymethyltransferase, partial [Microbacteriaceae bacterium]